MKITRRSFIKAGIVAPTILPSAVWAADAKPSERLNVGMIGMGIQNRGLMNSFLYRANVVAVCDVDTTRREHARKTVDDFYTRYPDKGSAGCKTYVDYKELLARKDIDAVCIATPDHWHTIITIEALRSGKDVYCEKPLTHNVNESLAIMKEVDKQGRVLQTGSMQRSMSEFRVACELARNGVVGEIDRIECSFGEPGMPCDLPKEDMEPGLDWDRWLGPAPERAYSSVLSPRGVHNHYPDWRKYWEYGGGMVTDWGAHHLDIAQWALGMDDSGPVKVTPPEDRKAQSGAVMEYANGVKVIHKPGNNVEIFGSEGKILVNRGRFMLQLGDKVIAKYFDREDGSLGRELKKAETGYLKDAKVKLYKVTDSHIDDFLRCIKSRTKPITNEIVGSRSAICCHLVNIAYRYGEVINWDPINCKLTGGNAKSEWLGRTYREKYNKNF